MTIRQALPRAVAVAGLLVSAVASSLAWATPVQGFQETCLAPNWITGQMEPVLEQSVFGQATSPYMAFTRMAANGRWQMEWNVDRIAAFQLPPEVIMFLFYHECAHARFAAMSEQVADCEGLRHMQASVGVSPATYTAIAAAYARLGRSFPTGDWCP